ncbi:MAG: hypothetical protein ACFBSE_18500 [Prochloraceae cyanobacterium]
MEIKLNQRQADFIALQLKKGLYKDVEQIIDEALFLFEKESVRARKVKLEELCERAKLGICIDNETKIKAEVASLNNVKVIYVVAEGIKSHNWSETCIVRLKKLTEYFRSKYPDIKIVGLKAYTNIFNFDEHWEDNTLLKYGLFTGQTVATFGTPLLENYNKVKREYIEIFEDEQKFQEYHLSLVQSKFTQLIRRFKAINSNKKITLYCVGKDLNLTHLTELGCELETISVVNLYTNSATRRQQDKRKVFQACLDIQRKHEKLTQISVALNMKVTQSWISKLFKEEGITWTEFIKLFEELYANFSLNETISFDKIRNQKLIKFLELPSR